MRYIILTLLLSMLSGLSELAVRAYLDSAYLVRGEVTSLTIVTSERISTFPKELLKTDLYTLEEDQAFTSREGNKRKYNYTFLLSSLHLGAHTIPSVEIICNENTYATNPVEFEVRPSSELNFQTVKIGDKDTTYAVGMFLPKRDLYLGETVRSELKIYLPYDPTHFNIIDYGVPEHKRSGMSAWRFQTDRKSTTPFLLPNGPSIAVTYKSSAHPIQTGTVSLGPGDIRPVFKCIISNNGLSSYINQPINLPFNKIEKKALPLPPGAPSSFKGAVGQFSLDVGIINQVRNTPSDPITTELTISGTGNLDTIEPPVPLAEDGAWKLYPATKKQRDGERRYLSGTVEFNQILRPTSAQRALPPFEFSYFNPDSKKYVTETSQPIPLLIQTSATPSTLQDNPKKQASPPSGGDQKISFGGKDVPLSSPIPQENMADVLGFLSPVNSADSLAASAWKYWQIIPGLLALFLFMKVFIKHLLPKLSPAPEAVKLKAALLDLKTTKETKAFLKKAAQFSTDYLKKDEHQALKTEVHSLRDTHCYQPSTPKEASGKNMRATLLKKLTQASKTALPLLLLTLTFTYQVKAQEPSASPITSESPTALAQSAYETAEAGDYSAALSLYMTAYPNGDAPVNAHYNIGTCYAKLKEPGEAMLHYRRALLKDPSHKESLQNMRHLESMHGSNVVQRSGLRKILSRYSLTSFKTLFYLLLWLLIISSLLLALIQKRRATAWCVLSLSAFLLPLSLCTLLFYPRDGDFSPIAQQAIITTPQTVIARTSASNTASQVIKAPPGSIGKVLHQRGYWVYLEFANQTRGWVSLKDLSMLDPSSSFKPVSSLDDATEL